MKRAAVILLLGLGACESRPPAQPSPRPTDKRTVFGDASLVPTREGEQARRELALAGELELALVRLGFAEPHVDVELREPVAVVVIARQPPGAHAAPEQTVLELATALLPELTPERLHLWLQPAVVEAPAPAPAPAPRAGTPLWAIVLASIGLGASLGVFGERLRLYRAQRAGAGRGARTEPARGPEARHGRLHGREAGSTRDNENRPRKQRSPRT